jgi:hypothetical protein
MKLPRFKTENLKWLLCCGLPYLVCALVGAVAAFLPGADWLEEWCDECLKEMRRLP